jgi:radical SAM-linked protein
MVLEPKRPEAGYVKRRIISDLDKAPFPTRPLVPYTQIIHDRMGVEIARGCTRGCRFCQAGFTYRPVRERSPQKILFLLEQAIAFSGWDELSLLSLSTGDYKCLLPLINTLMNNYNLKNVAISLPSLRVGTLNPEIMQQIQRVRKTGFTLAPEAGSERLRRVINKAITENDLIYTASEAYRLGWNNIKLYFMIGLPTETMTDVVEIAELAKKVLASRYKKKEKVTVSVGTFVPKPHTPFQWEPQISVQKCRECIELLKSKLRSRDFHYKWHDPLQSFLEGVFSRGDRRLTRVLYRAWKMGARLDAWSDHLRPNLYQKSAIEEDVLLRKYNEAIDTKSKLPWGHILTGVSNNYLLNEKEKALKEAYTPDCRHNECQACGVCNFKNIRPIVYKEEKVLTSLQIRSPNHPITKSSDHQITYHSVFSKLEIARFLGHLELLRAFHRAVRRAHIPVAYSQGFHPKPRLSFGPPIPLGTESLAEEFTITLTKYMNPLYITDALSQELPQGITIRSIDITNRKAFFGIPKTIRYLIYVPGFNVSQTEKSIEKFNSTPKWFVTRICKGKKITTDLKQVVEALHPINRKEIEALHILPFSWPEDTNNDEITYFDLTLRSVIHFNIRPAQVIEAVMELSENTMKLLRILKLGFEN